MAHQLDFKVTLWSDDKDELLLTEQMFKQFEMHDDNVGGSDATKRLHALSLMLGAIAFSEVVSQVDIYSVDINWDEEEDPLEQEQDLPHPTREQLYQGDWGKFDEEEAKRIRKLLYDADEQSEWGNIMHDQVMTELVDNTEAEHGE